MPGPIQRVRAKRTHQPDVFGHIPGVEVGTRFESRLACSDSAVHPGIMAGIYGSKDKGAYSVVLSGGYDDDEDEGESFVYTGCGGSDNKTRMGPQLFDQTFDNSRNKSLLISSKTGKPVRVVRGYNLDSDWAPASGYRYDGLYRVVDAWRQKGKSGHLVCKYEFKRLPGQPRIPRREGFVRKVNTHPRTRRQYSPIPEPKFEGIPIPASSGAAGSSTLPASRQAPSDGSAPAHSQLQLVPYKAGEPARSARPVQPGRPASPVGPSRTQASTRHPLRLVPYPNQHDEMKFKKTGDTGRKPVASGASSVRPVARAEQARGRGLGQAVSPATGERRRAGPSASMNPPSDAHRKHDAGNGPRPSFSALRDGRGTAPGAKSVPRYGVIRRPLGESSEESDASEKEDRMDVDDFSHMRWLEELEER